MLPPLAPPTRRLTIDLFAVETIGPLPRRFLALATKKLTPQLAVLAAELLILGLQTGDPVGRPLVLRPPITNLLLQIQDFTPQLLDQSGQLGRVAVHHKSCRAIHDSQTLTAPAAGTPDLLTTPRVRRRFTYGGMPP